MTTTGNVLGLSPRLVGIKKSPSGDDDKHIILIEMFFVICIFLFFPIVVAPRGLSGRVDPLPYLVPRVDDQVVPVIEAAPSHERHSEPSIPYDSLSGILSPLEEKKPQVQQPASSWFTDDPWGWDILDKEYSRLS